MPKSKVYFAQEISPSALIKVYQALGLQLPGKVAIKISTGEAGNPHYLQPALIKDLVQQLHGIVVECNTAYEGARNETHLHLKTAEEHGFTAIAKVDIMDADGEIEIPVHGGRHLKTNIIGKNLEAYDSLLNLAHFKGHKMAGFGGVLKNQAIGIASAAGKVNIHTAGRSRDLEKFLHAFDNEENMAAMIPPQDNFLESMAEAAKSVADYIKSHKRPIIYINIMNNLSVDCDCSDHPEAPCMADMGIAASLDPVALDQACIDLVFNSSDPGRDFMVQRIEEQNGRHIIDTAAQLGLGSKSYEIVEIAI